MIIRIGRTSELVGLVDLDLDVARGEPLSAPGSASVAIGTLADRCVGPGGSRRGGQRDGPGRAPRRSASQALLRRSAGAERKAAGRAGRRRPVHESRPPRLSGQLLMVSQSRRYCRQLAGLPRARLPELGPVGLGPRARSSRPRTSAGSARRWLTRCSSTWRSTSSIWPAI